MTALIVLAVAGIALVVIIVGARRLRPHDDAMGTLSSQWLDEHRRETHQTDR